MGMDKNMKRQCLGQPVIEQEIFQYEDINIQEDGYCYCFTADNDFLILPNGNRNLLWDMTEGICYDEMSAVIDIQGNGHEYVGLSISFSYECTIDKERLDEFSNLLYKKENCNQRMDFCIRRWKQICCVRNSHPVLKHSMEKITKTRGQMSVEAIAFEQDYTTRQVERTFLKQYGCSPKTMCRWIRMCYALEYMKEYPQDSFAVLAKQFDFSDASHFLREFRYLLGMTPKEFAIRYFDRHYDR